MTFDPEIAAAGAAAGFVVGLTGMGGGALLTPILVLLLGIDPLTAVSSDLVAAVVMKPVGGAVHLSRRTVHVPLVVWLMVGSIPAAFLGVIVLTRVSDPMSVDELIRQLIGAALLIASLAIVVKASHAAPPPQDDAALRVRRLPTLAIGIFGGAVVGMTSVGSGSLMMVLLILLYPRLSAAQLVGTDLVQAVPLVASAAVAHLLFGDVQLAVTVSLLVGSVPAVYLGARLSSRAPDRWIRPLLAAVLIASGLKMLDTPNLVTIGVSLGMLGLVAAVVWRRRHPE